MIIKKITCKVMYNSCCTNYTKRTYSKDEIKDLSAGKITFYC